LKGRTRLGRSVEPADIPAATIHTQRTPLALSVFSGHYLLAGRPYDEGFRDIRALKMCGPGPNTWHLLEKFVWLIVSSGRLHSVTSGRIAPRSSPGRIRIQSFLVCSYRRSGVQDHTTLTVRNGWPSQPLPVWDGVIYPFLSSPARTATLQASWYANPGVELTSYR
jgi:hypothetical protein